MRSLQEQHSAVATVCAFKLDKFRGFSVKRALHPLCMTMTETEWEMTVKVLASGDTSPAHPSPPGRQNLFPFHHWANPH